MDSVVMPSVSLSPVRMPEVRMPLVCGGSPGYVLERDGGNCVRLADGAPLLLADGGPVLLTEGVSVVRRTKRK